MIAHRPSGAWLSLKRLEIIVLIFFVAVVAGAYSFLSVWTHLRYMTFGLDLGYFDQVVWKLSQLKFPYSSAGCIWMLEDHFQPILFLFAPFYRIWSTPAALLIGQSILMVFVGVPLWLLSKKLTRSSFFSWAISFAYLIFIGTQFSILNEFHQITIAPLLLSILYLALAKRKRTLFLVSIVFLLMVKEDLSLTLFSIGVGLIFTKRNRFKGLILALLSVGFFFVLTYWFIPSISFKGVYSHFDFGPLGKTATDVILHVVYHPHLLLTSLLYPSIKQQTIFVSFASFAFLPLVGPAFILIPLISDFLLRFIYPGPQVTKWALVNHHSAVSAMLLAIASIYAARRLFRIVPKLKRSVMVKAISITLVIFSLAADVLLHGPIHSLVKKQFYSKEQWMIDNDEIIKRAPGNVSIAAQNNLLSHLTERDEAYRIPYGLNSEYMVFDLYPGPNKYAPLTYEQMKLFYEQLIKSGRYSIVYEQGDSKLLHRNYKTDITRSPYYGDTRYCYYSWEER